MEVRACGALQQDHIILREGGDLWSMLGCIRGCLWAAVDDDGETLTCSELWKREKQTQTHIHT